MEDDILSRSELSTLRLSRNVELRFSAPVRVERSVLQDDLTQTYVGWGDQHLVIRGAAVEPLAEGSEAFMTVEPRRVVLLEE